jgi:hypothetical protein
MESNLLKALYLEYETLTKQLNELNDKRNSVFELIEKYAVTNPSEIPVSATYDFSKAEPIHTYPFSGTWKEKIIYALQRFSNPVAAIDITNLIARIENKTPAGLANTITQYCSAMALAGEIEADKSSYRNKYFLKK